VAERGFLVKRYSIHQGGHLWAREDTLEDVVSLIRSGDPSSMVAAIHPDARDAVLIEERDRRYPHEIKRRLTYAEAVAELGEEWSDPDDFRKSLGLDEPDTQVPDGPLAPSTGAPSTTAESGSSSPGPYEETDGFWCGFLSQTLRDVMAEIQSDRPGNAHALASHALGQYDRRPFPRIDPTPERTAR
jgi:hypothetical protein